MGSQYKRTTTADRERIMRLYDEGLNYEVISRRTGFTARSVSRIVEREKEKRVSQIVEKRARASR